MTRHDIKKLFPSYEFGPERDYNGFHYMEYTVPMDGIVM